MDEIEFLRLPRILDSPLASWWNLPPRPTILGAAPIVIDGGEFQIHPDPERAHPNAWRPIVAIRIGSPSWSDERCAVAGDIIDFAALSPAADRVIATFNGFADVLGSPPDELFASARGPSALRLRRTPADWLADLQGAVLLRPWPAAAAFLRTFDTVVCDDVPHGEAVDRAMRRAYRGPEIRVAVPARRAA